MAGLTTTSHAILGLLSLRPFSAYELAEQSQRSLRFTWPTAQSRLYAEVKRLAADGLVAVDQEPSGPVRTRAVYRINDAGRTALREWLGTEPAPPRAEFEFLLRTMFADAADSADLARSLAAAREQARADYEDGRRMLVGYASGDEPFPERTHINLVWALFLRDLLQLIIDWTEFAEDELQQWADEQEADAAGRTGLLLDALIEGRPILPVERGTDPAPARPAP